MICGRVSVMGVESVFTLSESAAKGGARAKWIDHLVSCGLRAARYASTLENRQLVLALSVPQRDYAAVLIACGWVLGAKCPNVSDPHSLLERLEPGQLVRVVDKEHVVAAKFFRVESKRGRKVLVTDQKTWCADKIAAINTILDGMGSLEVPCRQERPKPGSLARMVGIDSDWDSWLVSMPADLAIIGTRSWIEQEMGACIRWSKDTDFGSDDIQNVLFSKERNAVVWNTQIVSYADKDACLNLPASVSTVILDGNGAIKYLQDLHAKIVICVLDRSTSSERVEENIVQYKNTRGVPISLSDTHGWKMLPGIEYMAFEVGL